MKTIRFFRMMDGVKIPCVMELTDDLVLVSEYNDTSVLSRIQAGRDESKSEISPARKKAMAMARWAAKSVVDNPIPGSEDLRASFFEELQNMHERAESSGVACKPCEQGKLIRRYRKELEEGGFL